MKLDYDLIKLILGDIERQSDGQNCFQVVADKIEEGFSQEQVDYHLQILEDDALVDIQTRIDGAVGTTMINRLTAEGHRVLEAIESDTFWQKFKSGTFGVGRDVLKQIPSLCIKMLLSEVAQ